MSGTSIGMPSGSFSAIKQGWNLSRRAPSVFVLQALIFAILVGVCMIIVSFLVAGSPQQYLALMKQMALMQQHLHGKPPSPAGAQKMMFTMQRFEALIIRKEISPGLIGTGFAFGVFEFVFGAGIMRGLSQALKGQTVRVSEVFWGFKRGGVWLLAIMAQLILFGLEAINLYASGIESWLRHPIPQTGFPVLHGGAMVVMFVVILVFWDLFFLAMATVVRPLSALSSLRVALKVFRWGHLRYLLLILAWMFTLVAVTMAFTIVTGIMVGVVSLFGVVGQTLGVLSGIVAIITAWLVGLYAILVVMPASFVVVSAAFQP